MRQSNIILYSYNRASYAFKPNINNGTSEQQLRDIVKLSDLADNEIPRIIRVGSYIHMASSGQILQCIITPHSHDRPQDTKEPALPC